MIKAVSLLSESCDAQLGMLMIQQTAKRNRQMDGKSVAAADIHKREKRRCDGVFHHGTCTCRVLVSALSTACGVCVLFWRTTEEFHTSVHPCKRQYLELCLLAVKAEQQLRQQTEKHRAVAVVAGLQWR